MNCDTVRRLIQHGIEPGSATPIRAELGFHLAQCPECRTFHRRAQAQLLANLLAEDVVLPAARSPRPLAASPRPDRRRLPWRPALLGFGAVLALVLALVVIPSVTALLRIRQNVQAMIIATAPALPAPTPELAPVSALVATSTPEPTAPAPAPSADSDEAVLLGNARTPASAPTPTLRALPTQTITPVPLDDILAVDRSSLPVPTRSGSTGGAPLGSLPSSDEALTVMLMGVDRRPGEGNATRADTILIARLEPARQRIAMLSLPRDLIVPIPGVGYARINAANVYGEGISPGGGLDLTRETVGNLLGVPIDYVVQVDFQGFIGGIDALGGIDIDVPTEIYDPSFPTMDYGYTIAHFLPGTQHMDGERALMYARTRHGDSDFERMKRQQSVLVAVLQRVRQQNTLQQLQSIADVTSALRGYIQTDMPENQMISLAWTFRATTPDSVERYTLGADSIQVGVLADDPYALFPVPGAIEELSRQLIDGTSE